VRSTVNPSKIPVQVETELVGLELGDVVERPLSFFRPDPKNAEFDPMKTKQAGYWSNLKRDIEQVGITTPLVAMPDGQLVFGHSRLAIASELGLPRLPVRLVLVPLTHAEIRTRRRMDNLLRFEVDETVRLSLLAEEWPSYYLADKNPGRPSKNADTVSVISADVVAAAAGTTKRKVERDRATVQLAAEIARKSGRAVPDVADIDVARKLENAKRRDRKGMSSLTPDLAGAGKLLYGCTHPLVRHTGRDLNRR